MIGIFTLILVTLSINESKYNDDYDKAKNKNYVKRVVASIEDSYLGKHIFSQIVPKEGFLRPIAVGAVTALAVATVCITVAAVVGVIAVASPYIAVASIVAGVIVGIQMIGDGDGKGSVIGDGDGEGPGQQNNQQGTEKGHNNEKESKTGTLLKSCKIEVSFIQRKDGQYGYEDFSFSTKKSDDLAAEQWLAQSEKERDKNIDDFRAKILHDNKIKYDIEIIWKQNNSEMLRKETIESIAEKIKKNSANINYSLSNR